MTATDDQGVKREAVACLQGGDALQQHCQAITCRCFNINSDVLGAHYFYTATSDLGDFSITRLQEVILASDDAHHWISIYTIKLRSRPSGAFLIGTSASPDIHLSTLAMRSD
ncbi:uncharacterized protein BO87DRAFT_56925 [Aspergillus neoniger CBS 115656]|uniref:Uncharacterized protein n=1 Tax=Aspergillus neoniger (strain CBS 115656) TaxID=1448310 RepID=A0A318YIG8_ASPNB|nr:hypothetical protein BO87DRAFT_56925 [Aspergillus neoniger CBS 115656]PYH34331.1 hypothetical protein BO87DRAFT_56925 [Aspergillus neoniger CBS 115656]